jgi:hypothetical protein
MTPEGPFKIARECAALTSVSKTYSRQNWKKSQIGKKKRSVLKPARIEGAAGHREAYSKIVFFAHALLFKEFR